MSIHVQVAAARQRLRDAGISQTSRIWTRGCSRSTPSAGRRSASSPTRTRVEPEGFTPHYETLVARRVAREPLAYIVGSA